MSSIKIENKGYTLIELVVSLGLTTIVMLAIGTTYSVYSKMSLKQERLVDINQTIRYAVFLMERDFVMAGYDTNPDFAPDFGIITAQQNNFSFNAMGMGTINYFFDDPDLDGEGNLVRGVDGTNSIVAQNVQGLEFQYILEDGGTALQVNANDFMDVVGVNISILIRSDIEVKNHVDRLIYSSVSGNNWNSPYLDGFQRKLITTSVFCRNLD
jgi:type IV pilus assembly protein PilW